MHGKEVLIMADLRAEAMRLIQLLPEEELAEILPELKARRSAVALAALDRIVERARKNRDRIPADFDYKKELEEAREERYSI